MLLELRATGDENVDNHTEWVAYTQGPGIDAPLMVRAKHGGSTHDIIPLANWRGLYEAGVFPDGRTAVDGLDLKTISWPAAGYTAYVDYVPDGDDKEPVWLGSLMSHERDASGQLYMRNRYYDPQSGRFTQEDPIGLAGGLNLYGFGGGDPVNYSDPYGLKADSIIIHGDKTYRDRVLSALVYVAGRSGTMRGVYNAIASSDEVMVHIGSNFLDGVRGCEGLACHKKMPFQDVSLVRLQTNEADTPESLGKRAGHELFHAAGAHKSLRKQSGVPAACGNEYNRVAGHECTKPYDDAVQTELDAPTRQ